MIGIFPGLWLAAAAAQPAPPTGIVFKDKSRDVEVRYAVRPDSVDFSAYMPAGWAISVGIDGDQNGQWGNGAGRKAGETDTSPDRKYGQDVRGGAFCAQYILASIEGDPSEVYMSSDCDGYPSKGRVEISQIDSRGRATVTLHIPSGEVFGPWPDAHLQVCLWDSHTSVCQHSPAAPFVLPNPSLRPQG